MSDVILRNTKVAIEKEVDEGVLVLPQAASSFIAVTQDSVNDLVIPAKEMLERAALSASLDQGKARGSIKSVNGTIVVEYKAGTAGAAPEYGTLVESALGDTVAASAEITTTTGNTTTTLNVASTTGVIVGDIVLVKEAGAYHVSPIASIVTDTSVTLKIAAAAAFSDAVKFEKLLDYRTVDSGHPSFSIAKYSGADTDYQRKTGAGCKVATMSLENWTTGQQPTLSFGYEGMAYTVSLNAPAYTPSLDTSLPIVALSACVWQDSAPIGINEFTMSLENTLEPKTTTCSENGRIGLRVTGRNLTGSINPYMSDDSIAQFEKWNDEETFSLFAWAGNPTSTAGEYSEIVAIFIPECQTTELAETDTGGLKQEAITFKAVNHATLPLLTMGYK
jgi:hypothetical protein